MRTFCCVASLVILCEPPQIEVLDPGDPSVVLSVVLVFRPLHVHDYEEPGDVDVSFWGWEIERLRVEYPISEV